MFVTAADRSLVVASGVEYSGELPWDVRCQLVITCAASPARCSHACGRCVVWCGVVAQVYAELGSGFVLCLLAAMPLSGKLQPINTSDSAAQCVARVAVPWRSQRVRGMAPMLTACWLVAGRTKFSTTDRS